MDELSLIENSTDGPLPEAERGALRFGSRAAYFAAQRDALVRFLKRECVRLVREWQPSYALHAEVRRMLLARHHLLTK